MALKHWVQAARLRTLPLSVSGIIVGCGLAAFLPKGNWSGCGESDYEFSIFILALLTTICFQILSNFANDYGDGVKGIDQNRKGEQRMVASGVITPKQMKNAMILTGIVSLILAIILIYISFSAERFLVSLIFFVLAIASIIAAIKYTVGKNAYGYSGLGDVFVFLFFGWLSVLGSYFLYRHALNWQLFLPASTIGLLSVAVLNLNNMRDRLEDQKSGKITMAVKLGSQKVKLYHYTLIIVAFLLTVAYIGLNFYSLKQLICLIAFIPLILNMIVVGKNIIHSELDGELKKVALSTFLFAILFALFN